MSLIAVGVEKFQRLTVDGLRDLIGDIRKTGPAPTAILLNEYDRREMNQDLMNASVSVVANADQRPEHDGKAIGIVEGVMIASHKDVSRGKARLVFGKSIA